MKMLKSDLFILLGFLYILLFAYAWVDHSPAEGRCIKINCDHTCEICLDVSENSMFPYAEE